MSALHVSLENAQAVTEHYSQDTLNKPLMRFVHFAAGKLLAVSTEYEDGAQQAIHDDLEQGKQLFIPHNHQHFLDPIVVAAMAQREEVLHPIRTRTVIPAKSPLFNNPLYGIVVRNGGAIPVFRRQDMSGIDDPQQKIKTEISRRIANDSLVTIMQAHMNNRGMHGVEYPEGTRGRNKDGEYDPRDPTKIQPLYEGMGRILCGLDHPENVSIVPIGTIYGPNHDDWRHPTSYVAKPFSVLETIEETMVMTEVVLQGAVSSAYELVT